MFKNKLNEKYEVERQPFAHYVKKEILRGVRVKLPVFRSMMIMRFKANPDKAVEFYERKGLDSDSLYSLSFAAFTYRELTEEAKRKLESIRQEKENEIAALTEKKAQLEKRIETMHKVNSSAKDEEMSYDIHLLESLKERLKHVIKDKKDALEREMKRLAKELQKAAMEESVQKLKRMLEHAGRKNRLGI